MNSETPDMPNPTSTITMRGAGVTDSERHLGGLAEHTFLNLWSFQNLYIDKMIDGQGKELCDLLVVCGNQVIIFSDKSISWPPGDLDVAWARWYKRAIQKSVDQVNGAARWLSQFPERVFLDGTCKQRLPLNLPPPEEMRLHGIVVARGAGDATRSSNGGVTGSLYVKGDAQNPSGDNRTPFPPFCVGDVNPDGMFVHVLDDGSLDIVLQELDTISDLTEYLSKKEELIRSGFLNSAQGEEDLVAHYLTHMISEHEHGFLGPDGGPLSPEAPLQLAGTFSELTQHPQYIAKKQADEASYVWDRLIAMFGENLLAGTTIVHDGHARPFSDLERGVRYMALEGRFRRRLMGRGILGALEEARKHGKFVRSFLPNLKNPKTGETAFFFFTLAPPEKEIEGGYERYRQVRADMLSTYALLLLQRFDNLPRVIGIATEAPPKPGEESRGSSEDLILVENPEWTDELIGDLEKRRQHYGFLNDDDLIKRSLDEAEWPEVAVISPKRPSRKERRALEAIERRKNKRRK